jgi:hypothetical protein
MFVHTDLYEIVYENVCGCGWFGQFVYIHFEAISAHRLRVEGVATYGDFDFPARVWKAGMAKF